MNSKTLNILGFILSILSLIAAVYFYQLSKKERIITFISGPQVSLLEANNVKRAAIEVYDRENKRIDKNLYVSKIFFWNRGGESIRKNNILKDIIIEFPKSRILDFKLLKSSREVSEIDLTKIKTNQLLIDFFILEKNDGFSAQIIYESNYEQSPQLKGTVESIKKFSDFPFNNYQVFGKIVKYPIFILLFVFVLLIGMNAYFNYIDKKNGNINSENENPEKISSKSIVFSIIFIISFFVIFPSVMAWRDLNDQIKSTPEIYVPDEIKEIKPMLIKEGK